MMWNVTKVTDEDDWFERYVRLALSVTPPPLPQRRHKLGATNVSWFETEPGVAFIDARGGTPDDRVLATKYLKSMLAGHGYRVAQYEVDYDTTLPWPTITAGLKKQAKWGDIMAKAKRLIQTGKVQLLRNGAENVVGKVIGDHGEYQTEFSREDPNSQSMTQWQCDCPWDQYAWQRTRQWKKYEGRPCAHVLATWWASQSHPVDEDAHPSVTQAPAGQAMPAPGPQTFGPDPMTQPMGPGQPPVGPMQAPVMPGQAVGTPPIPGMPPEVLPPFPMEGQLEPPQPTPVSIPGAKPPSPANPAQWPGGTLSSVRDGWDNAFVTASDPFKPQPEGFANGNIVQLIGSEMGVMEGKSDDHGNGQYTEITPNSTGEVLGTHEQPGLGTLVEVIFPLGGGELTPYHIRAWLRPDQLAARPDIRRPGPMIKRRR